MAYAYIFFLAHREEEKIVIDYTVVQSLAII